MGDYYGHGGGGGGGGGESSTASSTQRPQATAPVTTLGQSAPGSSLAHSDSCKIFVGGLSWQTTEESLRWSFEQYGEVVSVEIMRDRNTGEPRGFAFCVFADPATVDLVIADKGKISVNHKLVDVKRAMARGQAPPSIHVKHDANGGGARSGAGGGGGIYGPADGGGGGAKTGHHQTPEQMHTKVFVGGLPPSVDREELKQIFEQFGTVVDAIVMLDQVTQRSRGFGFCTFGGEDGTAAAQRSIAAQPVPVHGRQVEVKLATPRAEQTTGGNGAVRRAPPPGPKHVGLRAGQMSSTGSGEYAGLAVAYGRNGWKAGYGTKAFGRAGWAVKDWEDTGGPVPEKSGFSFSPAQLSASPAVNAADAEPPSKRPRH